MSATREYAQRKLVKAWALVAKVLWFVLGSLPYAAGLVLLQLIATGCHPEPVTWGGFAFACFMGFWFGLIVKGAASD